jgi:predicted alpha/beta hydrolase
MTVQHIEMPDNTQTQVHWMEPGDGKKVAKGVILFLPALGISVDYYRNLAEQWVLRGFAIALIETRGMRHSSVKDVKKHNFGYKEVLDIDLATIVPILCQQKPGLPIWLCGHSLGGQFALLHASDKQPDVAGVILIAGGSNHYASLPTPIMSLKRRSSIRLVRTVNSLMGYFPGHKLGFGGRQPKNLMKDWTQEGLKGHYKIQNCNKDYNHLLAELALPVLMISLSGDLLVPKSSANALAKRMTKAKLTQVELKADRYGLKSFNHFKWARKPDPVLDTVDQWLNHNFGV